MAESTKDLVAKRDMQLRMFDSMKENGTPKVPTKAEFDAMTPKQQADLKKAAMMKNLNLTPEEEAAKKDMEKKNMGDKPNKMARGGMAIANKYDRNRIEKMREAKKPEVPPFDRTQTPAPVEPNPTPDRPPGMKKGGTAKKMNMGGMTSKMSKQKGGNTVIVDPAKKSPKSRMKTSGSGSKMAMMKKGGNIPKYKAGSKVRGYGMARGGKACKMR